MKSALIPILDYAYLAGAVYYNKQAKKALPHHLTHSGWFIPKEINSTANFKSNFFGRLYLRKNQAGKVVAAVVAFLGTMPYEHPYNDLSDFKMAVLHELPISYKPARTFFHKARWYIRDNYPNDK